MYSHPITPISEATVELKMESLSFTFGEKVSNPNQVQCELFKRKPSKPKTLKGFTERNLQYPNCRKKTILEQKSVILCTLSN